MNHRKVIYRLMFPFAVILAAGIFAGILYNQMMPYAEGWYTYYAECINSGEIPYKDFDYLFPPMYLYLVAWITRIFGYKIIILRFIGILYFCAIALLIYFICSELFPRWAACISAVTAALYLQSESAQVFYDYVRFMDILSCLTILLILKSVKVWQEDTQKSLRYLFGAGMANACFTLVKQNMGILFACYAYIFIIFCAWCSFNHIKEILKRLLYYTMGFLLPVSIFIVWAVSQGCLGDFFNQTGTAALAAKGGVVEILFGWLINNSAAFKSRILTAGKLLLFLTASFCLCGKPEKKESEAGSSLLAVLFGAASAFIFAMCVKNRGLAMRIFRAEYPSTYGIFLIVFTIFLLLGVGLLVERVRGKDRLLSSMGVFFTAGSYFAISYGCGMSGGLAEGQAGVGIALIISLLLSSMTYRYAGILRIAVMLVCFNVTIQSGIRKMDSTYNWWGMRDAPIWSSTEEIKGVDLLESIKVSEKTKKAYESICRAIMRNTDEDEAIYCFPQIPIFYNLCGRRDPGVRAKVQWFDVCSDASILHDMEVIRAKEPKAVLIYNSPESAYEAHEKAFRNGRISGTRKMREFLYNYVFEEGYTFYGNYEAESNSLSLWIRDGKAEKADALFEGGSGTKEDPYRISTAEQLELFSYQVNNGRTFLGQYILQADDIDLSGKKKFTPIGKASKGCYFYGAYDGGGHVIKNLNIHAKDTVGLFGQLGGKVCNLGLEGGSIRGLYAGGIAGCSTGENAAVINCYTNLYISGVRAGGIADNFRGKIFNVYSSGTLEGTDYANLISYREPSYPGSSVCNGFLLSGTAQSGMEKCIYDNEYITVCTKDFMEDFMCSHLNKKVKEAELLKGIHAGEDLDLPNDYHFSISYETWMSEITLIPWESQGKSCPVFENEGTIYEKY